MKINNAQAPRTTSPRVQTGVRAGMMKQLIGRLWDGIVGAVGSRGDGGSTTNAVAGVRG